MTAKGINGNGNGNGMRSGAETLVMLAAPLNAAIVRALESGPRPQVELRRATGSPPQSTLRGQLKRLFGAGVLEKRRREGFPGVLDYELTAAGRDLIPVADALSAWLGQAPDGPLELGDGAAKAAVKALAEAWSMRMLRALAPGPLTLTELSRVISDVSYPSLERRLGAMRLAGQLETRQGENRGTPYAVTNWLRAGVAPLAAAARWERRHRPAETRPLGGLDVETAFLLAIPLLRVPPDASGACRLAVELGNGESTLLAGVTVEVAKSTLTACRTGLDLDAGAWAQGPASAWLDAIVEHDRDRLELGGDCGLARALADGLNEALFTRPRANAT